MEKQNENPIFGRKVFFINPPLQFENYVIEGLREQQYECYTIPDYRVAKSILKANQDALCFIYIDDVMSFNSWYKFIKSFQFDEELKSIFVGIISFKIRETDRNFFLLNANLPGGFTMLNLPLDVLLAQFVEILNLNGAKGRRQYIRLDTTKLKDVSGYFATGFKLFNFDVENLSPAGIALVTDEKNASVLQKNSVIESVSLTLGKRTAVLESVVFDSKVSNGKCRAVLLFRNVLPKMKQSIIYFTFDKLDEAFKYQMSIALFDKTDYENLEIPKDSTTDFDSLMDSISSMDAVDLGDPL